MRTIISFLAALFIIVIGLSIYLSPNDLINCAETPDTSSQCKPASAIVAVSGGDTAARTKEAIKLYQNGWAPKLIFSGAAQDKSGPSNAEVMRREARDAGVPETDILVEEAGETTKQNAKNTQSILEQNGITSVILVTSSYHQRRASLEFEKNTTNVTLRNHPVAFDNQWSSLWWLTPIGWFLAAGEFTKIIAFYLVGSR